MKVSIIIPTLNEAEGIAEALHHAWEAGANEVIVADGGSSDSTRERVKQCNNRLIECNSGRAIQQNTGANAASGDILLFLHADTCLPAGAISQIAAAVAAGKRCGSFRQKIEAEGILFRLLEKGNDWRAARGAPYGDQGIWVERQLFFDVGGFPEEPLLEDLLLMRLLRKQTRPALLAGPLRVSPRRWRKNGVLRQTVRNWSILLAHRLGVSPSRLAKHY